MTKSAADKKADAIRAFRKSPRPAPGAFDRLSDYDVSIGAYKVIAALRPIAHRIYEIPSNIASGFARRFG